MKIIMKSWNYEDKESNGKAQFKEIKARPCKENDFNDVNGSNKQSKFYATDVYSERSLQLYWNNLKCIDDSEYLSIKGNYDSVEASNMMIVFEKCDPTIRTCKTQEEIDKWTEYKYLVTFQNTKNFIQHEFYEKRIKAKAKFVW